MKERLDEIGSRLRELRDLNRVSPEEMAEHLKVPVETYNCYEDGKLDIPASILIGIARKLNVDTGLLLTGGYEIPEHVQRLISTVPHELPIALTALGTYTTAELLGDVKGTWSSSPRKIENLSLINI